MAVDITIKRKLVWGWLRLFLGLAQMLLASAGLGLLLTVGLHPITYLLVIAATAMALAGRLLYRGRPDSQIKGDKKGDRT